MAPPNYNRILGVKATSTLEEVRRRYRLLARRHHPDHNPDDPEAAARFRRVVEAFEALMADRAQARLQAKMRRRAKKNGAQYQHPRFGRKAQIFEDFFGIFQDGPWQPAGSAGADFRYDLEIPFVQAVKGMATVIAVTHRPTCRQCQGSGMAPATHYRECPECQGRGRRFGGPGLLRFGPVCARCRGRGQIVAHPCPRCHGQGSYSYKKEYELRIPPGTRDGARFRIQGEGGEGFHNGPRGNLLVVVHVAPHEFFTRVGNDIHCRVEVSFAEAALGSPIRIPTLEGYQTVRLPRGTRSGWSFRFLGAGAPETPLEPAGDQVNRIIVTTLHDLRPERRCRLTDLGPLAWQPLDRAGHE
jgi:molecular chaperone DnaJ